MAADPSRVSSGTTSSEKGTTKAESGTEISERGLRAQQSKEPARPGPVTVTGDTPIPVDDLFLVEASTWPSRKLPTYGVLGELRRWDQVLDVRGESRLIVTIAYAEVIYIANNRGWLQKAPAFVSDVQFAAIAGAGRQLRGVKRLLEVQAYFALGVLATTSIYGVPALFNFAIITGLQLTQFLAQHEKDLQRWNAAWQRFLLARRTLKRYAPQTYEVLFRIVRREVWERIPDNIPADQTAKWLGTLLGAVAFRDLSRLRTIIWTTVSSLAGATIPAGIAAMKSVADLGADAGAAVDRLRAEFQQRGVQLSKEEIFEILREVSTAREVIDAALKDLTAALDRLQQR